MARVVPSQVVALIENIFPWATKPIVTTNQIELRAAHSGMISVIVNTVDQIPPELITLEGDDYVAFTASLSILKDGLKMWSSPLGLKHPIHLTPGFSKLSPITLLHHTLSKCADEAPINGTADLIFITDKDFRDNLRRDVSIVHTAIINGEWKPATIIAGSVVEALLLWALQQKSSTDITNSINNLLLTKTLFKSPGGDLLKWVLHPMIEVSVDLKIISEETAAQCRLAREFRNLIHPGKAERLKINCSRGTALSATAAMQHVIEEFE